MITTKHGPIPKVAILIQAHREPQDLQKKQGRKGGPGESTKEKKPRGEHR